MTIIDPNRLMQDCGVKGCLNRIHHDSQTGVCRSHMHKKPYCKCLQCRTGYVKLTYRLKTEQELKDEGLL